MGSIDDFSQLCRLCLVKDQVNISIFDESSEIGQTFLKINSCLPVKVSRDDNLPKKICDGCSYKLDMLYIFRNTSVDSEKQLISWLNQAGLSTISQTAMKDPLANTKPEIMVKQETFDSTDSRVDGDHSEIDAQSYLMQQQQLSYQQDFDFGEASGSTELTDEPAPKRAKRAVTLKKAPIEETDETEDDLDAAMQITKAEEEDSDDIDQPDYVEPSTSADDQPGPSGVGKAAVEAPHENRNEVSFVCQLCNNTFNTYEKLFGHVYGHQKYLCKYCDKPFANENLLNYHVKYKHEEVAFIMCNTTDTSNGHFLREQITKCPEDLPHKCGFCNAEFAKQTLLDEHYKKKHQGYRYFCSKCENFFKSEEGWKNHEESHSIKKVDKKLNCGICSKVLYSKVGYFRHMRIHSSSINLVCEFCGKKLASLDNLRNHRKIHTGEKNHVCETCGKAFTRRNLLVIHSRVHTYEKPYECRVCGSKFSQKCTLRTHMRMHTGEKPYQCNICARKFTTNNMLKVHRCKIE